MSGQLGHFMRRIPLEDVAVTINHYLRSNNARYVASGHSVGCLLQDAEKLRTEALTGRTGTLTGARRQDKTQDRGDEYGKVLAELRAEDDAEKARKAAAE